MGSMEAVSQAPLLPCPPPTRRPPAFRGGAPATRTRSRLQCRCQRQGEVPSWQQRVAAAAASALLAATAPGSIAAPLPATAVTALQSPAPQSLEPSSVGASSQLDLVRLPPLPTTFPPLPPLELPKYQQVTLSNGLRVFFLEDHELPVVRGSILMRGGQRASPDEKVGLATLSAAVQRSGGSQAHPGQQLDDELEELAAAVEGGAGPEAFAFGFSCLKEDVEPVMGLFAEVILTPAVPQDKLDLAKLQVLNALEHRFDNPSTIPARQLSKLIYGADSVFARDPTPEQIASITADDVRRFLSTWERPDAAVMGLVGDFDCRQMQQLVEERFGGWAPPPDQPTPLQLPNPPLPDQSGIRGRIFLVDLPGASQSSVAVGEPGIQMMDPDEYALDVLGQVFNGFGGRLFNQIRSREGLAYSVGANWTSSPLDHPGLFLAAAETAQPAALLAALRSALQEATVSPPTQAELQRAKQETLNSFVFNFSSRSAQLSRVITFDLLGIPQDYLFRYRSGIEKVRQADVLAAAQRRLHPSQQTVVVVGDAARLRPELSKLGLPIEDLQLK